MKRVLFTFAWFVVFFAVAVLAFGVLIGDPAPDAQAGFQAGQKFGHAYGRYIILGSLVTAIAGSYFRLLPGTRQRA